MNNTKKSRILRIIIVICSMAKIIAIVFLMNKNSRPVSRDGYFFDNYVNLRVYSSKDVKYLDDCLIMFEKYEKLFSRIIEGSDIYNINHAKGEKVSVKPTRILSINNIIIIFRLLLSEIKIFRIYFTLFKWNSFFFNVISLPYNAEKVLRNKLIEVKEKFEIYLKNVKQKNNFDLNQSFRNIFIDVFVYFLHDYKKYIGMVDDKEAILNKNLL